MFEQEQEPIELDIDESNELLFKLNVEGAGNDSVTRVRLVCESDDLSYSFTGKGTQEIDTVKFVIPTMKGKITEGTYKTRLEVMVDNKYFVPVEFDVNFKKTVTVVAESVRPTVVKNPQERQLVVTASPVQVSKPKVKQEQKETIQKNERQQRKHKTLREKFQKKSNERTVVSEDDIRNLISDLLKKG